MAIDIRVAMRRVSTPGQRWPRERQRRWHRGSWALAFLLIAAACTSTGEEELPRDVQDPASVRTPAGATAFYRRVMADVPALLSRLIAETGVLTDELTASPAPVGAYGTFTRLDSRHDLSHLGGVDGLDRTLHHLRAQAREARGFLGAYAPDSSPALRGHLYALEGYAEIFLADVFCSGIPLSTVDFQGDYTLTRGFTTAEVYAHAVTLFDSAAALFAAAPGDSVWLQYLAAVGRGRALLALDSVARAAAAVAGVPDAYQYLAVVDSGWVYARSQHESTPAVPSVADQEGGTGIAYRSSGDARSAFLVAAAPDIYGNPLYLPAKYPETGPNTFLLAAGVEARLIEAEAALRSGGDWLGHLNALRTTGTFDTQPTESPDDDPAATDTLWHAGRGGIPGLAPLADPGSENERVDLMFRERALWLYLTAHRQGDLRRLIRHYQRDPSTVYPSGAYPGGNGQYGTELAVPMPVSEQEYNPQYTGCIHRNA